MKDSCQGTGHGNAVVSQVGFFTWMEQLSCAKSVWFNPRSCLCFSYHNVSLRATDVGEDLTQILCICIFTWEPCSQGKCLLEDSFCRWKYDHMASLRNMHVSHFPYATLRFSGLCLSPSSIYDKALYLVHIGRFLAVLNWWANVTVDGSEETININPAETVKRTWNWTNKQTNKSEQILQVGVETQSSASTSSTFWGPRPCWSDLKSGGMFQKRTHRCNWTRNKEYSGEDSCTVYLHTGCLHSPQSQLVCLVMGTDMNMHV